MQARNTLQCPRMPSIVAGLATPVAHACIPLKLEGETSGVLNVAARPGETFSEEELAFLETLGHQIGLAVERARHRKSERLRNQEARAMAAVSKAVGRGHGHRHRAGRHRRQRARPAGRGARHGAAGRGARGHAGGAPQRAAASRAARRAEARPGRSRSARCRSGPSRRARRSRWTTGAPTPASTTSWPGSWDAGSGMVAAHAGPESRAGPAGAHAP